MLTQIYYTSHETCSIIHRSSFKELGGPNGWPYLFEFQNVGEHGQESRKHLVVRSAHAMLLGADGIDQGYVVAASDLDANASTPTALSSSEGDADDDEPNVDGMDGFVVEDDATTNGQPSDDGVGEDTEDENTAHDNIDGTFFEHLGSSIQYQWFTTDSHYETTRSSRASRVRHRNAVKDARANAPRQPEGDNLENLSPPLKRRATGKIED